MLVTHNKAKFDVAQENVSTTQATPKVDPITMKRRRKSKNLREDSRQS